MRRIASEKGSALLEAAVTIPLLLLISVGIFDFGRAYQTWQVLTNAAREGARVAVVPNPVEGGPEARARDYMRGGELTRAETATITVDRNATVTVNGQTVSASRVTIVYPFDFIALGPVARLVNPSSQAGQSVTMRASALMRNEVQ